MVRKMGMCQPGFYGTWVLVAALLNTDFTWRRMTKYHKTYAPKVVFPNMKSRLISSEKASDPLNTGFLLFPEIHCACEPTALESLQEAIGNDAHC